MTDLERFFRCLVGTLARTDPARLRGPLPLADVRRDILPYRANRRALGLDSSEDYEMVLLRLCVGEGGLVHAEPEKARERFLREAQSPHPDLKALGAFDDVTLTLRPDALAGAGAPAATERERAPVEEEQEEAAAAAEQPTPHAREPVAEVDIPPVPRCRYCDEALPTHRSARFCPHCGRNQTTPTCPECHGELEIGWKHCVNCGTPVGED